MKKYILLIVVVIMLATTGCTPLLQTLVDEKFELELSETETAKQEELQDQTLYPYFNSLTEEEQEIYLRICTAIEEHDDSEIMLQNCASKEECEEAQARLAKIYQSLVFEQPQYFWVNIAKHENVTWTQGDEYITGIKLSFILEKEDALVKREVFQSRVDSIVQEAQVQSGTFEQVMFVYDSIMESATYNKDLADGKVENDLARTAYGCLVDQNTVCSGYTMAFNLIMQKLGYECGAEFNEFDIGDTTGHVWNYARLGDDCYYFDLTWDDTIFDAAEYKPYLEYGHQYFAITKEELPHTIWANSITPECNGKKYNYFIYNNWYLETYDFEIAKEMISRQTEKKCVELRFGSDTEAQKAVDSLFTNGGILDVFPDMKQAHYAVGDTGEHLYLFLD